MKSAKYGCQLPQGVRNFGELAEIARECERLGYDSVWANDHLSPYWNKRGESFECWTLLAAIAQRTEKIKLGSLVTNVSLRSPSLLAKITSTFDQISNGRLILGLGTGDKMSRAELLSYGYNFASTDERVGRLRETILILKEMWTKERASFAGKYMQITDAINFPKPIQTPHPPIWVGGKHTGILDVVAEMADGWNYWDLGKADLQRRSDYLSKKCAQLGRDPARIVKSWAGTLSRTLRAGEGQAVERIAAQLRSEADHETGYYIGSLGSNASSSNYEAFADAVRNLA